MYTHTRTLYTYVILCRTYIRVKDRPMLIQDPTLPHPDKPTSWPRSFPPPFWPSSWWAWPRPSSCATTRMTRAPLPPSFHAGRGPQTPALGMLTHPFS